MVGSFIFDGQCIALTSLKKVITIISGVIALQGENVLLDFRSILLIFTYV